MRSEIKIFLRDVKIYFSSLLKIRPRARLYFVDDDSKETRREHRQHAIKKRFNKLCKEQDAP